MKIYVYSEQCNRNGQVVLNTDGYIDDAGNVSADIWLWGEGTEEELIAQARRELTTIPANAAGAYRRSCARAVQNYLLISDHLTEPRREDDVEGGAE